MNSAISLLEMRLKRNVDIMKSEKEEFAKKGIILTDNAIIKANEMGISVVNILSCLPKDNNSKSE